MPYNFGCARHPRISEQTQAGDKHIIAPHCSVVVQFYTWLEVDRIHKTHGRKIGGRVAVSRSFQRNELTAQPGYARRVPGQRRIASECVLPKRQRSRSRHEGCVKARCRDPARVRLSVRPRPAQTAQDIRSQKGWAKRYTRTEHGTHRALEHYRRILFCRKSAMS